MSSSTGESVTSLWDNADRNKVGEPPRGNLRLARRGPARQESCGTLEAMQPPDPRRGQLSGANARFVTTRWSLVLSAGAADSGESRSAMGRLLETYWYPLYAFIRKKGQGPEDSCDLTQEFFLELLEGSFFSTADPQKGRFRTFLLTALERFMVDEWRRGSRKKRGGGRLVLSLSAVDAEERYRLEPADSLTPEQIFERRWAMTLLGEAMRRLEEESIAAGHEGLFAAVKPILAGEDSSSPYAELAARLGMKEGALKTAVHRFRRRFGALLRAEIAETISDPTDVEEEIRHLFQLLK
jgi:RNA polymerase sigma factor (sigma-70 family)